MKHLDVAVGVIVNQQNQILVALRDKHSPQGDLWEFPGGKREAGETWLQALSRELKEEIGIEVIQAAFFLELFHQYEKYSVSLNVWRVSEYAGEPHGAEGQPLRWVSVDELAGLRLPGANHPIVEKIKSELAAG